MTARGKKSPRGLLSVQPERDPNEAERIKSYILDLEKWSEAHIQKAGLTVKPGSEIKLAESRASADSVFHALVVAHQIRKLKAWLGVIEMRGEEEHSLAVHSAYRMAQLLFAGFQGAMTDLEPVLDAGRKVKFGGEAGAERRRDSQQFNTTQRNRRILELMENERAKGTPKMLAYDVIARRMKVSLPTVRRIITKN